ncbi:MAG: hypothetical protein GYA39_05510 [Methanothrix sp.]|nr:hypothetical protein [Methanothrix sp.]
MSKIASGVVLFSLLMALSFGVAFAEKEDAANVSVAENNTSVNVSINESLNQTINATINETLNETATAAAETK